VIARSRQWDLAAGRVYSSVNPNVLSAVAGQRILDIGCGDGSLGAELRARGATELVGIELVEEAANKASRIFDTVVHSPVEEVDLLGLGGDTFDTLIAADVLEHLVDPWAQLSRWRDWVKPMGRLVISVPNLRHWKVLVDLAVSGRFDYEPTGGVMDITHLRWFTKRSLAEELRRTGWDAERWLRPRGGRAMGVDRLTGRVASDFLIRQLTVVARPTPADG
jgi:2-polyprenyl-3-methyl-5-hydroxy-6-metoxy-1,4-benzoquinol methylase